MKSLFLDIFASFSLIILLILSPLTCFIILYHYINWYYFGISSFYFDSNKETQHWLMVVRDGWSKMKYHMAFVLQMLIICTSLYASKFFRQSLPDWFESYWLRKEPSHSFAKYLWSSFQIMKRDWKRKLHRKQVFETPVNDSNQIHLSDLPPELMLHVLSWLDVDDLCQSATVSQSWHSFVDDASLWWACARRHNLVVPPGLTLKSSFERKHVFTVKDKNRRWMPSFYLFMQRSSHAAIKDYHHIPLIPVKLLGLMLFLVCRVLATINLKTGLHHHITNHNVSVRALMGGLPSFREAHKQVPLGFLFIEQTVEACFRLLLNIINKQFVLLLRLYARPYPTMTTPLTFHNKASLVSQALFFPLWILFHITISIILPLYLFGYIGFVMWIFRGIVAAPLWLIAHIAVIFGTWNWYHYLFALFYLLKAIAIGLWTFIVYLWSIFSIWNTFIGIIRLLAFMDLNKYIQPFVFSMRKYHYYPFVAYKAVFRTVATVSIKVAKLFSARVKQALRFIQKCLKFLLKYLILLPTYASLKLISMIWNFYKSLLANATQRLYKFGLLGNAAQFFICIAWMYWPLVIKLFVSNVWMWIPIGLACISLQIAGYRISKINWHA
mmetsp:Transcript_4162/g.6749  ORF Transcript_4162/g.6749 Transcript_4162/m.6749 type:complete len:610 (+) Transcript_4162:1-1830(+)